MRLLTDQVIPHLVQNGLHVLSAQAFGANQAPEHPKHAPKATTLLGAVES